MMKNYFYILLLVRFSASAQYFTEDGYYQIRKLDTDNFDNFYFNEYEFNPVENAKTLAEIEKLSKQNNYPNIRYSISKGTNNTAQVSVYVNNKLFSSANYKNGLLDGKKTIFHGNGNPFHEIDYVNGKANGVYKMYNERNKLGFETHFKNNLKEGKRIMYPDKRKLESIEGTYKNNVLVGDLKITEEYSSYYGQEKYYYLFPNDLKNGKVKRYAKDRLIEEYDLVAGELHGNAIIYNLGNDKLHAKIPYTLGLKNGIAEHYDRNGELLTKCEFKFGKKIGKHEKYSPGNQLDDVDFYDENGNKTGTWIKYYYGKKNIETTYNTDGSIVKRNYDNNENLISISNFNSKNLQEGISQNFKNGILDSEFFYSNDVQKWAKMYYENGAIFLNRTPKGKYSEIEYFDKNGKSVHVNKVDNLGKPIGVHKNIQINKGDLVVVEETHYDKNGNRTKWIYFSTPTHRTEYLYRNEVYHGKSTGYNVNNDIISETYYYETNGQSKIVSKEEFEKLTKSEKK